MKAFKSRPACWTFSSSSLTADLSAVSLTASSALWAYFLNRPTMEEIDRWYSGFSCADLMTWESQESVHWLTNGGTYGLESLNELLSGLLTLG